MSDTNDYATRLAAAEAALTRARNAETEAARVLDAVIEALPEHAAYRAACDKRAEARDAVTVLRNTSDKDDKRHSAIALLTAAGYTVTPPKETP